MTSTSVSDSLRDAFAAIRGRRPSGLGRLGYGSRIERPAKLDGRASIFIGAGVRIRAHSWISAIDSWRDQRFCPRIEIGDHVYVGHYSCITSVGHLVIGAGSVLSEQVYIGDSAHGILPGPTRIMEQPLVYKSDISIGENSFVGFGARLLPGARLGTWSVVGANSVVNFSVPDFTMVAGAPARIVRVYSMKTGRWVGVNDSSK